MTRQFSVREAKARLSELLDLAAAGEEVEIQRRHGAQGRFRLISAQPAARQPGALVGRITIPDDFDREDATIVADFCGPP